ncbi:helix-turn-helix domain-containing protein [Aliarcobacter butzleri]|uniref:helix-turn-helix domain-containing protein n=1 Tax=Aliarcobacter TaxID=2321111 RepID=UPI002B242324|nr:helix-turn-helix domain-containing protein [Aliarcobacter butzleri]
MLLEEKIFINLYNKYAKKDLNSKLAVIKFYSIDTLTQELKNIQVSYENKDYSYFSDLADDIICNNLNCDYKEYLSSSNHFNNIEAFAKIIFENYIQELKKLINNKTENIDNHNNSDDKLENIKIVKEKEYLTTDEVSLLFQLKKDKLLELRNNKKIKYFQDGDNTKVLFNKKDIENYMNKNTF